MAEASTGAVRVVVVDDEPDLRLLITRRLERTGGFEVVGEAEDVAGAIEVATVQQPDVILLDLLLGPDHGRAAVGPLMRSAPKAMIAALTALPAEQEERDMLAAGAFTFYEKSMLAELPDHLTMDLELFHRALAGEDVCAPTAIERRHARWA